MVVLLRFNQPVRPRRRRGALDRDVRAARLGAAGDFSRRRSSALRGDRPAALDRVRRQGGGDAARRRRRPRRCALRLTNDWDKKRFPPSPDSRGLRDHDAACRPRAGSSSRSDAARAVTGRPGDAGPRRRPTRSKAEPAFFVDGFDCRAECDPDDRQSRLHAAPRQGARRSPRRSASPTSRAAPATSVREAGRRRRATTCARRDELAYLTLEDAGFERAAAREHVLRRRSAPDADGDDGQTLGYTWAGHGRELAPARVHELRRRPRRVGERAAARCCRSTRATSAT